MLHHLAGDGGTLPLGDSAVGLRDGKHHGGGRLACIVDGFERMLGKLAPPTPAPKKPPRLIRGAGNVARRIGGCLHAKQNEQEHAEYGAHSCKDVHGSLLSTVRPTCPRPLTYSLMLSRKCARPSADD